MGTRRDDGHKARDKYEGSGAVGWRSKRYCFLVKDRI